MLANWTGADIAGIIAAVVAVGGAVASYSDRKKAEAAADRAGRAQKLLSHSASVQDAREAEVLCVEYDGGNKLMLTNPFTYQIRRVDVESMAFDNLTAFVEYLSPLETKTLQLSEPFAIDPKRSGSRVHLTWDDQAGERRHQYWRFTS